MDDETIIQWVNDGKVKELHLHFYPGSSGGGTQSPSNGGGDGNGEAPAIPDNAVKMRVYSSAGFAVPHYVAGTNNKGFPILEKFRTNGNIVRVPNDTQVYVADANTQVDGSASFSMNRARQWYAHNYKDDNGSPVILYFETAKLSKLV